MKYLIIILLVIVSFIAGKHFGQEESSKEVNLDSRNYNSTAVPEENCQAELNKAKEYYGKAFLIFLANIGVELSSDQNSQLTSMIKDPTRIIQPDEKTTKTPTAKEQKETEVIILSEDLDHTPFGDFIKKHKANIEHINDKKLIDKNSGFILKDPGVFYVRSKFIKSFKMIKTMNGYYSGKLFLFLNKNKGETHDIEMSIEYNLREKENDEDEDDMVNGKFNLKISEDGNVYSNTRGNGGNGDIRLNANSLIIEASPSSFFHFEDNDITTANYYDNNKLIGFARFRKLDE